MIWGVIIAIAVHPLSWLRHALGDRGQGSRRDRHRDGLVIMIGR